MRKKYLTIKRESSGGNHFFATNCFLFLFLTFFCFSSSLSFAQEKGKASYYSHSLHGRRMSDGTPYHRDSLICAHKRYPLGTKLKVTNLNNGKSVVVKVADRGPHARGRIIDLSYRAAKEIGMIASGVVMVKVEPFKGDIIFPLKPEEDNVLPELDFEIADNYEDYIPEWQKKEDNIVPLSQEQRHEIIKDNKKIDELKEEIQHSKPTKKKDNKKTAGEPAVSRSNPHKASQRHQ